MANKITLENLCSGAIQEKVNRALYRAANNILDPNTDHKKKREVNIKITLLPNKDNVEDVMVSADVSVKLAQELPVGTMFYLDQDLTDGTVSIVEYDKGQIRGQISFNELEEIDDTQPAEDYSEDCEDIDKTIDEEPVDFRRVK